MSIVRGVFGVVSVICVGCAVPSTEDSAVGDPPPPPQSKKVGGGATSPCAPTVVETVPAPVRWDMEGVFSGYGQNLMTPVDDQLGRPSCWVFAQVSQIEMEYARQYSLSHTATQTAAYAQSLDLSKQYYIEMTSLLNTGPAFSEIAAIPPAPTPANQLVSPVRSVADLTDLNQTCGNTPLLGLPPTSDWEYARRDASTIYSMMRSMPLKTGTTAFIQPDDAAAYFDSFAIGDTYPSLPLGGDLGNGLSYRFNLDLANFFWVNDGTAVQSNSVYPPPAVHEDARYAPMAVRFMAVFIDDDVTTPPAVALDPACTMAPWQYPIVTPTAGPTSDQITCYNALAAPYEALLSQNHPIVITTRPSNWFYDWFQIQPVLTAIPPPSFPPSYWNSYNASSNYTQVLRFTNNSPKHPDTTQFLHPLIADANADQHFVTLIGYDHERQLFHFKNEAGTNVGTGQGAGPDGTFWMTYDLLFRTQFTEPEYIDGVWDPTNALAGAGTDPYPAPAPIPTGNWFGFWQGTVNGIAGLAVIGHFPYNSRGVNLVTGQSQGQIGNPVGTFYFSDGSPALEFQMTSWDSTATTYTGYFNDRTAAGALLFTLTATFGSAQPTAVWTSATPSTPTASWSKCGTEFTTGPAGQLIGAENVEPETWLDVLDDPYLLPPCSVPTWRVAPTWSCNTGDTLKDFVAYKTGWGTAGWKDTDQPGEDQVTRLCLTPARVAPSCPAGTTLKRDLNWIAETWASVDAGSTGLIPQTLDACVTSTDSACLACDSSTTDCVTYGPCGWDYYPPTCPTPAGLTSTSYLPWLGSAVWGDVPFAPALWEWVKLGADTCVAAAYPPTATCPAGYYLSPNGTDCLVFVRPPPPPPPPPPGGGRPT